MFTQTDVEAELQRLCDKLELETELLRDYAVTNAKAEVIYRKVKAEAFLKAEGSMAMREAEAADLVADEHLAWKLGEAGLMAQQELLRTIRAQLDALRTIATNIRAAGG